MEDLVGSRVKQFRRLRGWSQSDLADRLSAITGASFDQPRVARLENGKRGVSVSDLLILARGLGVSPLYLITEDSPDGQVAIGAEQYPTATVRDWVRGFAPLPGMDRSDFVRAMPFDDRVFVTHPGVEAAIGYARAEARARSLGTPASTHPNSEDLDGLVMELAAADEGYQDDNDDPEWAEAKYAAYKRRRIERVAGLGEEPEQRATDREVSS